MRLDLLLLVICVRRFVYVVKVVVVVFAAFWRYNNDMTYVFTRISIKMFVK